jgi:hypothetical protein
MKNEFSLIPLIIILILVGCEGPILNENRNRNRNPVKLQDNGDYLYSFKVTDCKVNVDAKTCALETIKQRNLIPANCKSLRVLKAGWAEYGEAWAEFNCEE